MDDYYTLLGVPSTADHQQIHRAYRDLARRWHPDRGGSHEMMVRLNEAYSVLPARWTGGPGYSRDWGAFKQRWGGLQQGVIREEYGEFEFPVRPKGARRVSRSSPADRSR